MKILLNAIRCKSCAVVVVSTHRHDMRTCKCGKVSVDGGLDYVRASGNLEDMEFFTLSKCEDGFFRLNQIERT